MFGYLGSWQTVPPQSGAPAAAALRFATEPMPPVPPRALRMLATAEEFEAISVPAADLVINGRVAKYFVDLRHADQPQVYFINANAADGGPASQYHYYFAQATLDIPEDLAEFNRVTYFSPVKRYAAGQVHTYLLGNTTEPVYALQFYPQDIVHEDGVLQVVEAVRAAISIPASRFAFVPTGVQQTATTIAGDMANLQIEILPLDQVLGDITYLPLNAGEASGYLRIYPRDQSQLTPADIPVFDELPLDLSVVAGVMTRAVQDSNSHVNLKSKERGTPNMVLRDAGPDNPRLAPWADRPIRLVVAAEDFTITETTAERIAAELAERDQRPRIQLPSEPETRVLSFDEIAADSAAAALGAAARFGTKAANLGFLRHRDVLGRADVPGSPSAGAGYDLVPAGFAVPLSFYRNLVDHPPNGALRDALAGLITAEGTGQSTADRIRRIDAVQGLFLDAQFPPDDLALIRAKLAETLPGAAKIKVRSSANAEDVANFDGAGLHDSFAATAAKSDNPDQSCRFDTEDEPSGDVKRKVKPKTLACAVKGVYASLWNQRAVEERAFARIDNETVAMGLAVVGTYDAEADVSANAVVITRVLNSTGVYGYSMSTQVGNNLVTNPDPQTYSETNVIGLGVEDEPTSITISRYAKPAADAPVRTEPVLTREQTLAVVDVATAVERAYCAARRAYYRESHPGVGCDFVVVDDTKDASIDLEFKVLANGHLVCKQVREFGGR